MAMLTLWPFTLAVFVAVVAFAVSVQLSGKYWLYEYQARYESQLQQNLTELFLFIPIRQLIAIWFAALLVLIAWLAWLQVALLSALAWLLALGGGPWLLYRWLKARRAQQFQQQWPDALMLLASMLRAGASFQAGLQFVQQELPEPMAQEIGLLLRQLRIGTPIASALQDLAARMPSIDTARVVVALQIGYRAGGQQAPLIERLAASMRKKQLLQQRIRSLSAQGRMQGRVMTGLPVLLAVVLWHMEREVMEQLLLHPLGWGIAATMALMLGLGQWLISRLLRIQVPL